MISGALQSFMDSLIDYAGLFPPARLDLDTAVANYARYRSGADAWMLGRFIISARQLAELTDKQARQFSDSGEPFRFSVLVGGGTTVTMALKQLAADSAVIHTFAGKHGTAVSIGVLEMRLADEILAAADPARTTEFLGACGAILKEAGLDGREIFVEAPLAAPAGSLAGAGTAAEADLDWQEPLRAAIAGLAGCGNNGGGGVPGAAMDGCAGILSRVGCKVRCGGVEAAAFPPAERIALALAECRNHGLPLKCTAGLHHPVRFFSTEYDAKMHGFFNVFGAGLLAWARDLPQESITRCLRDEEAASFRFGPDGFTWEDFRLDALEVAEGRHRFMTGFGSCSFDEPRDDLRSLGLLD